MSATSGCSRSPAPERPAEADGAAPTAHNTPTRLHVDSKLVTEGRVKIEAVAALRAANEQRFPGEVLASEQGRAEVSSLVAGRLAAIEAKLGTRVAQGQTLAWVESPEVGRAVAELLRARAREEVAARKLERLNELDRAGAASKVALDEARGDTAVARADLAAARAWLVALGGSEPPAIGADGKISPLILRLPLKSPIAGIITRQVGVLGGSVQPDRALFEVVRQGEEVVVAKLPETFRMPSVTPEVYIVPRGREGERCAGALRGEFFVVDEATRSRTLRIEPQGPCPMLRPGGFVEVLLVNRAAAPGARTGVTVPREAIVDVRGVPTVFIAEAEPGAYRPAYVRLGESSGTGVVVEEGLSADARIVTTGALLLKGELLRAELQ